VMGRPGYPPSKSGRKHPFRSQRIGIVGVFVGVGVGVGGGGVVVVVSANNAQQSVSITLFVDVRTFCNANV